MSEFSNKLLPLVKTTLRETSAEFDTEIAGYIDTCAGDLQNAGILEFFFDASRIGWEVDSQILQAVRWYCLSTYGLYNSDMEKYAESYNSLKALLATQKKYTVAPSGGVSGDFGAAIAELQRKVSNLDKKAVPAGGKAGDVLTKTGTGDHEMAWKTPAEGGSGLPDVSLSDEGKFLVVSNGKWVAAEVASAEGGAF